jgi:uncharacterized protein HemX
MSRFLLGLLLAAVLAAALFYLWNRQQEQAQERLESQVAQLKQETQTLRKENDRFRTDLAKVQEEEGRLVTENQMLIKEIEQSRLTGKVPVKIPRLPYPPK